jgi:hypothetical protein
MNTDRLREMTLVALLLLAGCGGSGAAPIMPPVDGGPPPGPLWSARPALGTGDLAAIWGSGTDLFAAGSGDVIVHSGDHGQSWTSVSSGIGGAGSSGAPALRHIAGTGGGDVWVAGSDGAGNGVLLHSGDHGQSWQPFDLTGTGGHGLAAVWAIDTGHLAVASVGGEIFVSGAATASWSQAYAGRATALYDLWGSADGGDLYAAGAAGAGGILLHSQDHGQTWSELDLAPPSPLWNVWGTPDATNVYAAGPGATVTFTVDHAVTWLVKGLAVTSPSLDLTNVWVAPDDAAAFFTSAMGIVRTIQYLQPSGSVQLSYESLPAAGSDGASAATAHALWGPNGGDVWAVGSAGSLWHRP